MDRFFPALTEAVASNALSAAGFACSPEAIGIERREHRWAVTLPGDSRTDAVNGIFDYDSAAWADRHHDFRYLVFDLGREDMLEAALEVYEPAVGRSIDRTRVCLYNAACAICFLAFRFGTPAEQKSCGRTLAEDLRWVRAAVAKCV